VINTGLLSLRGLEPVSDTLLRLVITNQPKLTELGDLRLPQLRDCLLHNNGLTSMAGLQNCPSIQRLWLNGNKLSTISHLDNAANLRELWLQRNELTDCWAGLQACKQLEVLAVAGNPIRNLAGLQRLQALPSLRSLSLEDLHFGSCPVAATEGYRHFVVATVPQLTVVDEQPVQDAEREGATKALLSLGDALKARVHGIREEYDRADVELDSRLARHAREAAAVVGDVVAQLQAVSRTVQEGKAMMRADYQGQISPGQRAQQDYALALDIFERQSDRWGQAREAAAEVATGQLQAAAAHAEQQAPWLCAVRTALPEAVVLPPSAPCWKETVSAAAAPQARQLLPSGLAMDYSALRRAGSAITAASAEWVSACTHCVLGGVQGGAAPGAAAQSDSCCLYAPLPAAHTAAAYMQQWHGLQAAQASSQPEHPSPAVLFAHPSDACAWACSQGWATAGVVGIAQVQVHLSQDTPMVHSDNGGSALLSTAAAAAALKSTAQPQALIRLEVGQGTAGSPTGTASEHWALLVSRAAAAQDVEFRLAACLALHLVASDAAAVASARKVSSQWEQQGPSSPQQDASRPVPPPGVFLAQASQMLDRARAAYEAAADGSAPPPPPSAEEAAAEQRRAFARIMGTRRAIDSVKSAQATLLAQMTEGGGQ